MTFPQKKDRNKTKTLMEVFGTVEAEPNNQMVPLSSRLKFLPYLNKFLPIYGYTQSFLDFL